MAHSQSERPLHNLKVLVTRPEQRAAGLCRMIEQAGGIPQPFAAIEITEPADTRSRDFAREHIGEFALAIFISPTAVEKTLGFLHSLPAGLKLTAIGSRTAQALESSGLSLSIQPEGHDSEALLAQPQMQQERISGSKIVIFKGEGGRELLGDTLRSRGAEVFYADMYRRALPASATRLNEYLQDTDAITISSNEGLQNLYDLASDKQGFSCHNLVVPGERAAVLAKALGFSNIIVAKNATDEAIVDALEYALQKMSKKP